MKMGVHVIDCPVLVALAKAYPEDPRNQGILEIQRLLAEHEQK